MVGFLGILRSALPPVLGVILLLAAGLKVVAFFTDPTFDLTTRLPVFLLVVGSVFEAVVGLLLLIRSHSVFALLMGMLLFAFLFVVAMIQVIQGRPSCGCIGQVELSPVYAATFDLLAALALAQSLKLAFRERIRTSLDGQPESCISASAMVSGVIWGVVLFVGIGFSLFFAWPDFRYQMISFVHPPLQISPAVVNFGDGRLGEARVISVEVKNRSGVPVTILGGNGTCDCLIVRSMPIAVEPGSTVTIPIELNFDQRNVGDFRQGIKLYSDVPTQSVLSVQIRGSVFPTAVHDDSSFSSSFFPDRPNSLGD